MKNISNGYTGLTRAKNNISLINYKPITPLLKIKFKDSNTGGQSDKNIYFVADKDKKIDSYSSSLIQQFSFTDEKPISILLQLHQFVINKLEHRYIRIKSINHANYQEIYELEDSNKQFAKVSIYYNKKGQIKVPTLINAEPKQFGVDVIDTLMSGGGIVDFNFISDDWRKRVYAETYSSLNNDGYKIDHIIQTSYKDTIKITKNDSTLTVDLNYDGDGFFTSIITTYYSDKEVWNYFQTTLKALQQGSPVAWL